MVIYLLIIKVTGQEQEFRFCVEAFDGLVDTIFDMIEQESTSYQETLSELIKEIQSHREKRFQDYSWRGGS